jgi:thiol-disulfide isomerase/thioredoxin
MPVGTATDDKDYVIQVDTSLIYYPGNIELDHVRNVIRDTKQKINLQQSVFVSESEKASLEEIIDKDIIVIDFWGTWCKPCI